VELKSAGGRHEQLRTFLQPGIFDQARQLEPRLRPYTNDRTLGLYLAERGCDNTKKVLRRQGWSFPGLKKCREDWEKKYPQWSWRNPNLAEWQAEPDDLAEIETSAGPLADPVFRTSLKKLEEEEQQRKAAEAANQAQKAG
jgi:hypothetical protein